MEYTECKSMDIYIKLQQNRRLKEDDARKIFIQCVDAVKYC